jgi:nitroreductase
VLHIDMGIATQNIYLVSTALGLACCAVAGFAEAPPRGVARDRAARPAVPARMAPLITGWPLGHRYESCRGTVW